MSAEKLAPGVPTQGPPGPTTGPAGGDLAGSYPNPSIGSLRVTTDKLATGAVTTDKLADEFVKGDGEVYANRVVVPAGSRPQVLVVPGFVTLAAEEEGCRGDRADMAFEYPGGINDIWWEQANPAGLFRSGGGGLLLNPATTQRVSQWIGKGTGEDAEVAKVELVWHANGSQCSYVARAIVNR